jgi:hypothetical protein
VGCWHRPEHRQRLHQGRDQRRQPGALNTPRAGSDADRRKTSGGNVVAGTWTSAYDGKILDAPTKVEIDHLVPLADAWRSGAATWTDARREAFANDLDRPELVAVSTASNRAKGDQDPSSWRPQVTGAWCD